jgi:hypothetical protein
LDDVTLTTAKDVEEYERLKHEGRDHIMSL